MFVPEILYQQPLLKDRVTQQLEIVNQRIQVNGSSANSAIGLIYVVPVDRFFFFSTFAAVGFPEAASGARARGISCNFQPDIFTASIPIAAFIPTGIALPGSTSYFGGPTGVWMPPGARLGVEMAWDVDTLFHVSNFAIHGVTIPRGNMARA